MTIISCNVEIIKRDHVHGQASIIVAAVYTVGAPCTRK
jgi:hypothetical protein